nr:hypothetical protein [Tanacetum cinerariifolium]
MVNTRTDAGLSAAVQNTLQTLLPQIRKEIREECHTGSGSSNAGEEISVGLRRSTLNHLMCMSYTDNAARNYEILHERDDDDTEQRSGDRHQPTSQQSSHMSHGQNNDRHGSDRRGGSDNHRSSNNNYSGSNNRLKFKSIQSSFIHEHDPNTTVLSSPGVPLRATLTEYALLVDVDTKESVVELQADKKPGATGRVFAITEDHAANTSVTIMGTQFIYGHAVFVLFDTGATHSE